MLTTMTSSASPASSASLADRAPRGTLTPGTLSPERHVPASIARPEYMFHDGPERVTASEIKDAETIERIRAAGRLAARALAEAATAIAPGVSTDELDRIAHEYLCDHGAYPSCLGYMGFPKSICTSINEVICHGIPVVGHLGFTPQSVNMLGGFRVQGRGEAADVLLADAQALAEAGAVALVLEMVPEPLAARVTESLTIPTIGIGAGARCDGQVLVWTDMAGMTDWSPRFAHQFGQVGEALRQAAADYGAAVREESFPAEKHWFSS